MGSLADGRAAALSELAGAAGRDPDEIAAILHAIRGMEWDADGRVAGMGMTLNPTPHRVETGGHRLHAWCAADALGVLPAIGRTVRIASACPQTEQTVTVIAGPDDARDLQPPGAVVSAIITGDWDNFRGSACDLGISSPRRTPPPTGCRARRRRAADRPGRLPPR